MTRVTAAYLKIGVVPDVPNISFEEGVVHHVEAYEGSE